jgi:fatty acid synthase
MAKALMPIDIFANKIEECVQILKPFNVDLKHILLNDDKNSMSTMTNKFIATTSMQIALVEVLKKLDITPDGIIGHSFGEIACAYADGCLTTEEAVLTSYWRGIITETDRKIPKGLMAAVGLSFNEARKICPKGVDVVCDNSKDSVTISGKYNNLKKIYQ